MNLARLVATLTLNQQGFVRNAASATRAAASMNRGITGSVRSAAQATSRAGSSIGGAFSSAGGVVLRAAKVIGIALIGLTIVSHRVRQAFGLLFDVLTGKLAFNLARAAAPMQGIRDSFMSLTQAFVGGGAQMLASLQNASAGMIDNIELMRSFNLMASLVSVGAAARLPDILDDIAKFSRASGESMSFLLDSLARGVGRLSPRIIDNLGVVLKLEDAYQKYADELGRTADSLTQAEKQTAVMIETERILAANVAKLPEVFGSAQQVLQAFLTDLKNLRDDIGLDLLPAFGRLLAIFRELMPVIKAMGNLFAGTFSAMVDVAISFARGFGRKLGIDMEDIARDAEGWGQNIVLMLARGIASAVTAVIQALNYLGQVISYWLSPGSPPRILPDIDKWGRETAEVWLRGFTHANVSILRDLSSMVARFLQSSMSGTAQEIAGAILSVRRRLEEMLSTGRSVISVLPAGMQAYARALLAAQQATLAVERAQARLNAITEKYQRLIKPISDELRAIDRRRQEVIDSQRRAELNAILNDPRATALARELALLELREIALRNQQTALEDEQSAAEEAAQLELDAAKDKETAAKKQFELQEMLLQQQIETNNLMKQMMSTLAGGGAAGAAGSLAESLSDAIAGFGGGDFGSGIVNSVSQLTQDIIAEFDGAIVAAEALGERWGFVWTLAGKHLGQFWKEIKPYWRDLQNWLKTEIPEWLQFMSDNWEKIWGGLALAYTSVFHLPMTERGEKFAHWLINWFVKQFSAASIALGAIYRDMATAAFVWLLQTKAYMASVAESLEKRMAPATEVLRAMWVDHAFPAIISILNVFYGVYIRVFLPLYVWLNNLLTAAVAWLAVGWAVAWLQMQFMVMGFWNGVVLPIFEEIKQWLEETFLVTDAANTWGREWVRMENAVATAWETIGKIFDAIREFGKWLAKQVWSIDLQLPPIPTPWDPNSPIPLYTGWKQFADLVKTTDFSPMMTFPAGTGLNAGGGGFAAPSVTVNIGDVHINNDMDMQRFETRIREVIRREI